MIEVCSFGVSDLGLGITISE
jgi:hypothetical protein